MLLLKAVTNVGRMATRPHLLCAMSRPSITSAPFATDSGSKPLVLSNNAMRSPVTLVRASGGKPHSHRKMFIIERAWILGMMPLFPAALIFPSPIMDYALAVAVALHTHWGLETVAVDYVRPYVVGETIAKIAPYFIMCVSAVLLGGLLNFNYNDVGICKAFQMIWSL